MSCLGVWSRYIVIPFLLLGGYHNGFHVLFFWKGEETLLLFLCLEEKRKRA